MKSLIQKFRILFFLPAVFSDSAFAEKDIQEIIVTSDFRESQLNTISTSITVIDASVVKQRNNSHIEQILMLAPNVNFASGASRGKYFQIRGIGERSQFGDPLNPSVGTYIDGIDFTGIGGAATLLDIDQIEILRGSQGTRFGANSLAGVFNIKSFDPSTERNGYFKTSLSSHNSLSFETASSGMAANNLLYRLALGINHSDGYIENTTLNKNDTNNLNEVTSRLKLRFLASEDLDIDLTFLHLDLDNGFDAFSLDENRKTMSDSPGHDRQKSDAFAIKGQWRKDNIFKMNTSFTSQRTEIEYGFDEDWSYGELWLANQGWDYSVFDNYYRDIARNSAETRLLSGSEGMMFNSDWIFGIYTQNSKEDGIRVRTGDDIFQYKYSSSSDSIYFQLNTPLGSGFSLESGLRYEDWKASYFNLFGIMDNNDERLIGGKLSIEYSNQSDDLFYFSIAKGYKAGGFNTAEDLPSESIRRFETEFQWNYEAGIKISSINSVSSHFSIFYIDRKNLHLKSSRQEPDLSWTDFISNAGEGYSYGAEMEFSWQLNENFSLVSNIGYLKTKILEHNNPNRSLDLTGRSVAHAPSYTFFASANYLFSKNISGSLEIEGKDKYFYSDSHNYESAAYALVNARMSYRLQNKNIIFFVNNLTDKEYGTRGFDFSIYPWDQDPRVGDGYDELQYQQLGSPRVIGLSLQADF